MTGIATAAASERSPEAHAQDTSGPVARPAEGNFERWSRIPQALRDRRQWCVASQYQKRPLQVDGRSASSTDSTTWTDFETASGAAQAKGWHVGYVLTADDPFTCIDLDVKGDVKPEDFDSHIQMLDSYTERSVSGKGFHVWVEGRVEKPAKSPNIEIYSQDRFMICTGNVARDRPIMNRDGLVKELAGEWHGRYASHSELDVALTSKLWRAMLHTPAGQREKAKRLDYARSTMGLATSDNQFGGGSAEHGQLIAENILRTWKEKRRLALLIDEDLLALPPQSWLVKGIVPEIGIGSIFGQSGTYKSFLALDLLAHIANGTEMWFGKRVTKAPCVYVPFEGRGGIPNRVKAWRNAHVGKSTEIRFFMEPINLRRQEDRDRLVESLIHNERSGGVLCIDTLAAAGGSFEENSSKDMGEMIAILNELQQRLGGVILIVHHSGKIAERGLRGHSSLGAALDFAIECIHGVSGPSFRIDKQKDGESGLEFPFSTQQQVLGQADGDEVSSLSVFARVQIPATDLEVDAVLRQVQQGGISQRQLIEVLSHISKHKVEGAVQTLLKRNSIRTNGKRGPAARLVIAPPL